MILVAKVDFIDKQANKRYNVGDRFECLCDETAKRFIDAEVVDEVDKKATKAETADNKGEVKKEVKPKGRPKK